MSGMLAPPEPTPIVQQPPRSRTWVVVAVVVGLIAAVVAGWWFVFGDGERSVAEDEFVLGTDSPCEWFTAEEMTEMVAAAQAEAGTQVEFDAFEPGDCRGDDAYHQWGTSDGWLRGDEGAVGIYLMRGRAEPDQYGPHELLGGAASYVLVAHMGPGVELQLRVEGHDDAIAFGLQGPPAVGVEPLSPSDLNAEYELLGLAVARLMLEDMGWID